MPLETRGGIPSVFRATIPAAGYDAQGHRFPATTKHVRIRNYGATTLRVYFLKDDYDADVNYLEVTAGSVWEGPAELQRLWLKGDGGATNVEIVSFARLG